MDLMTRATSREISQLRLMNRVVGARADLSPREHAVVERARSAAATPRVTRGRIKRNQRAVAALTGRPAPLLGRSPSLAALVASAILVVLAVVAELAGILSWIEVRPWELLAVMSGSNERPYLVVAGLWAAAAALMFIRRRQVIL